MRLANRTDTDKHGRTRTNKDGLDEMDEMDEMDEVDKVDKVAVQFKDTALLDLRAARDLAPSDPLLAAASLRAEELAGAEKARDLFREAQKLSDDETRRVVVEWIRHYRPRTVILPFPVGRHPDHRVASELARDACYLAGLKRYDANGRPHRPFKILYALAYREDPVKPTFVVDISATFKAKMKAIHCYRSQFEGAKQAGEIFPTGQRLFELIETQAAHYGSLIRTRHGEPFFTPDIRSLTKMLDFMDSRVSLRVASFSDDEAALYRVSLNLPFSSR